MKRYILFCLISFVFILSSCVVSLHRLVTYDKVITESRITGVWEYDKTNIEIEPVTTSKLLKAYKDAGKNMFAGMDKNDSILSYRSYILSYQKEELEYSYIGSIVKLNGELFIDIFPLNADSSGETKEIGFSGSSSAGTDFIVTHSIARVLFNGDHSMELQFMDDHFLKEQIENGKAAIKHEKDDLFNTLLITASSEDLQKFLLKYGKDERLFSSKNTFNLKKV